MRLSHLLAAPILCAVLLTACQPPTAPEPVIVYVEVPAEEPEPPAEPETPAEPAVPVWAPEPWHIYILDAADAIVYEEEARPESAYRSSFTAWGYTVEMHNLIDDPAHPWHAVGGGAS